MATLSEQIKFSTCKSVEERLDEKVKGRVIDMTIPIDGKPARITGRVDRLAIIESEGVLNLSFIVNNLKYITPLWLFLNNCRTSIQQQGKVVASETIKQQFINEGFVISEDEEDELDIELIDTEDGEED